MLHIREDPIHCIDDKCIYPSRKNIDHLPKTHNYNDLYGAEDYSKGRFKDLGIPIFIMKVSGNSNESVQEEKMHIQQDGVISDDLFDKLFDSIEKKPKAKGKTRKNRKKKKKTK
jgi:hypothetical protein